MNATVKILRNERNTASGKLADAELHFSGGELDGLKLIGFSVWSRQDGKRLVTFPARQFTVDGERRSFSLLRAVENPAAQARLRDFVMQAYLADVQEKIEGVATS
jgi:xanthine dehydrogenase molybdopterin-binding subunit B